MVNTNIETFLDKYLKDPNPQYAVFLDGMWGCGKKYRSLREDLRKWCEEIVQNPLVGGDLGGGVRKIRIAISSKGKGKSSGARILTLNVLVREEEMKVTLLTIYDKSEMSSVSDAYMEYLLQHI